MTRNKAIRKQLAHTGLSEVPAKTREFQGNGFDRDGNRHALPETQQTWKGVGLILNPGIVRRIVAGRLMGVGVLK